MHWDWSLSAQISYFSKIEVYQFVQTTAVCLKYSIVFSTFSLGSKSPFLHHPNDTVHISEGSFSNKGLATGHSSQDLLRNI